MKAILFTLLLVVTPSFGMIDTEPEELLIKLDKMYVPTGFDSNDVSQVVVTGVFSNTCYQVGPTEYSVDENEKTISIAQRAYLYSGVCLKVDVPFYEIVNVGIRKQGRYRLFDANSTKPMGELQVKEALNSGVGTDNFPYAPITEAYTVKNDSTKRWELVLKGIFTNRCMKYKESRVEYYDDTIVALPIVKMISRDDCTGGHFRFQKRIALKELEKKAYLIHIRSMNGQSLNRIHFAD